MNAILIAACAAAAAVAATVVRPAARLDPDAVNRSPSLSGVSDEPILNEFASSTFVLWKRDFFRRQVVLQRLLLVETCYSYLP